MTTKIALVGIGKIARDQHLPAIGASEHWELAATVSHQGKVAGVDAYNDIQQFLKARPDVEVLSLCLPPLPRFEYASAAIAAGRHVMLEKPPGATLAECQALKEMAKAVGVTLFATWHSREAPQVGAARQWLADKTIQRIHVSWKEDVRRWHPGQTWIWESGGLGVFDPGINALSILTKILHHPIHLQSSQLYIPENLEMPIAAKLQFFHPQADEVSAEFDFRQQGEQIWSITVVTDQGELLLSDGGAIMSINGKLPQRQNAGDTLLRGEYPRLYARMADLIQSGQSDVDFSPMMLVADAFLIGKRHRVEPYVE
jgi:D-galactose 1-dehydrogenase